MGSTFNPQILTEKLMKLNDSQQSIETLSHWCIYHMNKAKSVVDIWARQFHCSAHDQRVPFLYLANDILQNSRKKGIEFGTEFWRVLPDALRDVIRNGDGAGKNAARRLINIWDERKVFGSLGHILEEFVGRQSENGNRNGNQSNLKPRQFVGNVLGKAVSDYEMMCRGDLDDSALLSRCTSGISTLEKMAQELRSRVKTGEFAGTRAIEEFQGQHAKLKGCIEQLTALETSIESLVSHLRGALQDQELKLDRVRSQLQAAKLQSDQATIVYGQLINKSNNIKLDEQGSSGPPGFAPGESRASPVMYTKQVPAVEQGSSMPPGFAPGENRVSPVVYTQRVPADEQCSSVPPGFAPGENRVSPVVYTQRVPADEQGSSGPPGFAPGENRVSPVVYTQRAPTDEKGSSVPPRFAPGENRVSPVVYTQRVPAEDDSRKSTAVTMAAKLTASTSSARMLSPALTSLVSGAGSDNKSNTSGVQESPDDRQPEKKPKLENNSSIYETPTEQPPPPPSSPPPLPPLPPPPMMPTYTCPMQPQFIQSTGSMPNMGYTYGTAFQPPIPPPLNGFRYPSLGPPMTGMSPYGPPANQFQNYQVPEGGYYSPPPSVPMAPMSHQQSSLPLPLPLPPL